MLSGPTNIPWNHAVGDRQGRGAYPAPFLFCRQVPRTRLLEARAQVIQSSRPGGAHRWRGQKTETCPFCVLSPNLSQ